MSALVWDPAQSRRSQAGLLLGSDSALSGFGEGGGSPCLSRGHPERFFGKHRAQLVLAGQHELRARLADRSLAVPTADAGVAAALAEARQRGIAADQEPQL